MAIASQLQLRRGTTAQHAVFTGAPGEVTVDTDKNTLVVHDGSTVGGFPISRADVVSVQDYGAVGDGVTSDSAAIEAAFAACPSGGCIYFPPTPNGYRITHTVRLWQASGVANRKKNITFLGDNTRLVRKFPWYPISASAATDVITCQGHLLQNGDPISFCNLFTYNGLDKVVVSGAGTSAVNGTYNPAGWYQTKLSYSNGIYTLRWNNQSVRWEIVQGSTVLYRSSDNKRVPWNAGSWVVDTGSAPAPTSLTRQRDIVDYGPNPDGSANDAFLNGNIYYVRDAVLGQSFRISATPGGPAVDITINIESGQLAFPVTSNGTTFTAVGTGYTENDAVWIRNTGNSVLNTSNPFYAVNVSGNTFGVGYTQFWSPPVNHNTPVTQGFVVAAPCPLFETRNTEGYKFEGLHFDGGKEFRPLPLATNPNTQLLSYSGVLQFVNDSGYLPTELCNNISIRRCSFTDSNNFAITYFHGNVYLLRGDNFTVQECLFRNLDAAIVGNVNAPRRLSFSDNHIIDGAGRQYLDPALWAEGQRPFSEWFTWAAGGSAIVLMADLRTNLNLETREDPNSHTSHMWTISGNVISNWGHQGGELSGPHGCTITGNVIEKTGYGLSIVHGTTVKGIVATGNAFRSNTVYDLEWGSYGGVISGNYFDGRAWNYTNTDSTNRDERSLCGDGIIIYGPEYYNTSPPGNPIPASADNVGTTITGNVFTSHRQASIRGWYGASNTIVVGNIFHRRSNGGSIVAFYNPAKNVVIDGNSFIYRNKAADPAVNPSVSGAITLAGGFAMNDVAGIVGSATTAVATTSSPHYFLVGDIVWVAGANQSQFNGVFTITAKTATTFTYTMASAFTGNATGAIRCGLKKYLSIDRVRITNNVFEGDPYGNAYVLLLNNESLTPSTWTEINDVEISGNASPSETTTPRGVWVANTANAIAKYTNIRIRNNSGRIESSSLLSMRFDQTDCRLDNIPDTAPNFAPSRVGDLYFNDATKVMYASIGTSSSSDWKALAFWQP